MVVNYVILPSSICRLLSDSALENPMTSLPTKFFCARGSPHPEPSNPHQILLINFDELGKPTPQEKPTEHIKMVELKSN